MADRPQDLEQAELKKRAMRRLIVAVILVAAAVTVLTFLGRSKPTKPVVVEKSAPEIAPSMMAPPLPMPETPPVEPPAAEQPPAPEAAPQPATPPPPEVVNKALPAPSAKPAHGVQKPAAAPQPVPAKPAAPAPQPAPKPAEKAAAPAAKPAEAPAPNGYVVQLGVFTNYANAQQLQERLAQNGIKSYTETRVHVGPFQNKAEADLALAKIKAMGIGAVVVPTH